MRMVSPLSRYRMLHPSPARGILSGVYILVRIAESRRSGASLSGTVGELFGGSSRRVRDVIWGDVSIDRAVKTLLETGAMQRLRGMSQLGFTFGSFPRARHTRLDHAVGVYHLAGLTLKRIAESGAYLEDRDVRAALAAALLLDAGRYPYAASVEGIKVPGAPTLKELSRRWIEHTEVAKVLRAEWDLEPHNVFSRHALRIPTVMFLRAVHDAIGAGSVTFDELSELDDAGAFVLLENSAESSTAGLMKRLADRRPYYLALEFDERHPSYSSLIRLRDDASWRRRVEEAWSRYLTRYRKGVAGPLDILIDLPARVHFPVELRLIRRNPLPGERNPIGWQNLSGMSEDEMTRYHAPLRRILIATANDDLVKSVRRHAEELFTIAEEVG